MTDELIKSHFGPNIIYKYVGKLESIKQYQLEQQNTSSYLQVGRDIYFISAKETIKDDVVVAFDTREVL